MWPQFAAHGKAGITVRHVLTHTAGAPQLPSDITPADLADWDRMCAVVADSEPLWTPGTMTGYHAWTFGWLIGEVVRRVTGRTMSEVLADEVAGPRRSRRSPGRCRTGRRSCAELPGSIPDVDGVRLVSPERLSEVTAPIAHGPDWVFGKNP